MQLLRMQNKKEGKEEKEKMKNTECVISITTKNGRTWRYTKGDKGWTQTGPNGVVRPLTAEQLLSHILPPLAIGNPGHLKVKVEQRTEQILIKKKMGMEKN